MPQAKLASSRRHYLQLSLVWLKPIKESCVKSLDFSVADGEGKHGNKASLQIYLHNIHKSIYRVGTYSHRPRIVVSGPRLLEKISEINVRERI